MDNVAHEVLLYFGLSLSDRDGSQIAESVDKLRQYGINDSRTIIDLITPAYWAGCNSTDC